MILAAASTKLRKYKEGKKRKQNNALFKSNHKNFYSSLQSQNNVVTNPPDPKDVDEFWRNQLGKTSKHNEDAAWLKEEEIFVNETKKVKEQEWKEVTEEKLDGIIRQTKNWKAPGADQVHNYWFKHLRGLHPILCQVINHSILHPDLIPTWLTGGRTTLLYKKGDENIPKNYCPITCLPTTYKLITLLLTDRVYQHLIEEGILPPEQKGIKKRAR
eukprot:2911788-Ditylum_brightwellii.AAC.1